MSNDRKKAAILTTIVMVGFVASLIGVPLAYATYYKDHSNDDAQKLLEFETYYDAAIRCMDSSKWKETSLSLSSARSDTNNSYTKNYYNLNGSYLFDDGKGSSNSNLAYGEILESYTGKYDDGKIYCSELNILPKLLDMVGAYSYEDLKKLACNGSNPGIFKITAGYGYSGARFTAKYDNDDDGVNDWPEGLADPENGANCSANLDFLLKYLDRPSETIQGSGRNNHDYAFNIKIERADEATEYFKNFVEQYVGERSSLTTEKKDLIDYWRRYKTFDLGCATVTSGQTEAPLSASDNMVGVYYEPTRKTYYFNKNNIHQNDEQYINIDGGTITCLELATSLAPDSSITLKLQRADKEKEASKCIDTYNSNYDALTEKRDGIVDLLDDLNALSNTGQGVLDGRLVYINNDVMAPEIYYHANIIDPDDDSAAISSIKVAAGDFVDKINEYIDLDDNSKESAKENLQNEINTFKRNVATFEQNVVDGVKNIYNELPKKDSNGAPSKFEFEAYLEDHGRSFVEKIEGVYETDENNRVICKVNQTFEDISTRFKDIIGVEMNLEKYEPTNYDDTNPDNPDNPDNLGDPCYNAGVDGMSWILCPAINNMAGAVDGIDKLLREWLSIDSSWMNTSSGTYTAWGYCRDIANLLLIVVLIAVIISQVTGYGIDNYGIKKILPRLIAIAILVNLSFIICQLLADLSNILGTSLDKLFQSVGRTISGVTAGQVVSTIIAAIFGVIAGAGAAAGTVITIIGLVEGGGGVMLVISLVLVLLIALVAVMMFFLMLGARMIIIIIFSALSPIAFACFVLPNTQKWFKKWWDIYKAALVMYPICGALYGISYVIRGIVFSGEGVHLWMALIAVCAPFIPFLILPTLLKGALSALGAVGNSIMSLGNGLKKGISKGNDTLRNTAAYQQAQEFNRNKLAEKRANRTISRLGSIESSGGKLTNSQRNRLYKARMTANEAMMRNETEKAGVTMIDQSTAAMRAKATRQAQETKLWSDQLSRASSSDVEKAFIAGLANGNTAQASAAFNTLKDTGNLPKIHKILNNKDEKGNEIIPNLWKNMSSDMRLSLNQDMIKSGDVAMKTYAKRSFAADNQGSFAEFMAGRSQTLSINGESRTIGGVGEELAKIGSHALDGQDKDSVEFLANHMDGLINNAASNPETRGSIAKMIMSGATSTQSGEEKKRFAEMIKKYKASFGGNQAAYEKAISEAVSAAQLAKLDSSIYGALGTTDEVNRMLSGAIAEIKKDNNATLYAGMSNTVKEAINKPAAPPIPPTPPTPPAP